MENKSYLLFFIVYIVLYFIKIKQYEALPKVLNDVCADNNLSIVGQKQSDLFVIN